MIDGVLNKVEIYACCQGVSKTAYGYIWMYEEDYENMKNSHTDC
jgi:hypothetical protein